ncbi:hypothetical protein SADUNF_Sadunf10G0105400 [Salix dunnii]|uniref:Uncharacterized protein n=1 Tax=Salix dunnii TaxID=1413687 RepID=A0A835MQR0_9ROSI|nr:hypothetical protein SADUNF_Sadunf10G0105400 [Salix dunnii]
MARSSAMESLYGIASTFNHSGIPISALIYIFWNSKCNAGKSQASSYLTVPRIGFEVHIVGLLLECALGEVQAHTTSRSQAEWKKSSGIILCSFGDAACKPFWFEKDMDFAGQIFEAPPPLLCFANLYVLLEREASRKNKTCYLHYYKSYFSRKGEEPVRRTFHALCPHRRLYSNWIPPNFVEELYEM